MGQQQSSITDRTRTCSAPLYERTDDDSRSGKTKKDKDKGRCRTSASSASTCNECNSLHGRTLETAKLPENAVDASLNCLGSDCFSGNDEDDDNEESKTAEQGKHFEDHSLRMDTSKCECDENVNNCEGAETACDAIISEQNGNITEDGRERTNRNSCVKSSSIHRYMSAFSDRPDKAEGASSKCIGKNKSKLGTKMTSEASTSNSNTDDKKSAKLKKKQWVPKFCASKLKTTKVNVNKSNESGLDVVSSSSDLSCVCTMYRKVDASKTECAPAEGECPASCQLSDSEKSNLNMLNLPFNITVARVALSKNEGVYGTIQNAARQAGSTGLYGRSTVYGALFTKESDGKSGATREGNVVLLSVRQATHLIDLSSLSTNESHLDDCDERARVRRAQEIAEGVEPPPGYRPHIQVVSPSELTAILFHQEQLAIQQSAAALARVHTQVDYIHCLIPDLQAITTCSFYWGKMDRYEAERLLEGKPEGTFLLRDSAHEDHLFSVSFRKYDRSLHARIEQFNHKFSFDARDPGVYASNTVTGLIEHYKDDACLMFFEPMLTRPLPRTHTFTLQHLCRSVIASNITYDGINQLRLPNSLKAYLKEYHYRQRVRVKRFEDLYDWESSEALRWEPSEAR